LFLLDKKAADLGTVFLPDAIGNENNFLVLNISNRTIELQLNSEAPFFMRDPISDELVTELTITLSSADYLGVLGTNQGLFFVTNDGRGIKINEASLDTALITNENEAIITNEEAIIQAVRPSEILHLLTSNLREPLITDEGIVIRGLR